MSVCDSLDKNLRIIIEIRQDKVHGNKLRVHTYLPWALHIFMVQYFKLEIILKVHNFKKGIGIESEKSIYSNKFGLNSIQTGCSYSSRVAIEWK